MLSEINKSSRSVNEDKAQGYAYEILQDLIGPCHRIISLLSELKTMKYWVYDFNLDEGLNVFRVGGTHSNG
jgi:hypothetical protein